MQVKSQWLSPCSYQNDFVKGWKLTAFWQVYGGKRKSCIMFFGKKIKPLFKIEWKCLKKTPKNKSTIWSDNPTSENLLKIFWNEYVEYICAFMCIATLFTVAIIFKQTRCPSPGEWTKI